MVFCDRQAHNYGKRHSRVGTMAVDRTPHLTDVRQIGPNSERDISGRCSACGVVLIARLDNWENANPDLLRNKLENLFARHLIDTTCGEAQNDPPSGSI
jgi:hypothetical protein